MKKFRLSILILTISIFGASAQTSSNLTNNAKTEVDITNSENEGLNLLTTMFGNQETNIQTEDLNYDYNNYVRIQQIGDYNYVFTNTKSQTSSIELNQLGNYNEISLDIEAPSIQANIIQEGNNNSVLDNIYYTNQNVELNLIQKGDNLTLNRIGSNSLTSKITLVQEGSFKTITLISN